MPNYEAFNQGLGALSEGVAGYTRAREILRERKRQEAQDALTKQFSDLKLSEGTPSVDTTGFMGPGSPMATRQEALELKGRMIMADKAARAKAASEKILPSGEVEKLSKLQNLAGSIKNLGGLVTKPGASKLMGPIQGRGYELMGKMGITSPNTLASRDIRSQLELTKQLVGKALEEGVLRAEDAAKYNRILGTVTDEPEAIAAAVKNAQEALAGQYRLTLQNLGGAGYNVKNFKPELDTFNFEAPPDDGGFKKDAQGRIILD